MADDVQKSPLPSGVAVSIAEDRMSAYVQLIDPKQAETITKSQLMGLLKANGVVFGLKEEALENFLRDPRAYSDRPLLVAEGIRPIPGKDGYIVHHFDVRGHKPQPSVQQDGSVDLKNLLSLNNVKKGQLLAERIPPQKGRAGTTVTGEEVPAQDGKEAVWKLGQNVVLHQEKDKLYAAIDGLATITAKNKLNVFSVFTVHGDVDYHVGHIDFVGTVIIHGNVLAGFKVKASGDICVDGIVEGAVLEAEGSIQIGSGIYAANKGSIKAGVHLRCAFMQDAHVEAGEDIEVSQAILHSKVKAGRSVNCTAAKGLIVGGSIQAGESIVANTIGNPMNTATVLEAGVAPELRSELQELTHSVKSLSDNLKKTEQALHLLNQQAASGTITPERLRMRMKLISTKRSMESELDAAKARILELEASLAEISKAYVKVNGTVYPGTKIVIGRYTRFVKDAAARVQFQLERGEVVMNSH